MVYSSGHVEDPKVQTGSLVPVVAVALCPVPSRGSIALNPSSSLYISSQKAHQWSCRLERVVVSKLVGGSWNGPGPELEIEIAKLHDFVEGSRA